MRRVSNPTAKTNVEGIKRTIVSCKLPFTIKREYQQFFQILKYTSKEEAHKPHRSYAMIDIIKSVLWSHMQNRYNS